MGDLVLRRGVRLGVRSACLSLGRGTQLGETLATICCVPCAVITPNVVGVKTVNYFGALVKLTAVSARRKSPGTAELNRSMKYLLMILLVGLLLFLAYQLWQTFFLGNY